MNKLLASFTVIGSMGWWLYQALFAAAPSILRPVMIHLTFLIFLFAFATPLLSGTYERRGNALRIFLDLFFSGSVMLSLLCITSLLQKTHFYAFFAYGLLMIAWIPVRARVAASAGAQ